MKQDMNLGWTSYDFKSAPNLPTDAECKEACNRNPSCDFYAFIDSVQFKCWCGEYKKPEVPLNLDNLKSVTEVTLKFKKGVLLLYLFSKFKY